MKLKLKSKILLMVLIPIIIMGVALEIYSCEKIKSSNYNEIKQQLLVASTAGLESYDYASTGDYAEDSSGNIIKGTDLTLTGDNTIVDNIKKNTGIEATFFYGDERVQTSIVDKSGNRIIGTKAQEKIANIVLKQGKSYFTKDAVINGKEYFGYYIPIKQPSSGEVIGMFFTGMTKAKINALINEVMVQIIILSSILIFACAVLALIFVRTITKSLSRAVQTLEEVAAGSLAITVNEKDLKKQDEIGHIAQATEKLKESLKNMIGQIINSANVLRDSAEQLDQTMELTTRTTAEVENAIEEISSGAMSQAEETQEASENVMAMGNLIEETVKDVENLNNNSKIIDKKSSEAISIFEVLNDINRKTEESIKVIATQTATTNESAQKIRQATALITSIAEETNLLSLNASIEAARAGEQGRGFAVVAAQIQKLADQSNESAQQIEQIINVLIDDSDKAVNTMNEVKDIVRIQSENVNKTKEIFGEVNEGIQMSVESVKKIADRTEKLDESRISVVDIVQGLSGIAEENAASTEETNAATEELSSSMVAVGESAKKLIKLADKLNEEIKVFKL